MTVLSITLPFFEKLRTHNNVLFKRWYVEVMLTPTVVDPKVNIIDVVTEYREEINQKLVWPIRWPKTGVFW